MSTYVSNSRKHCKSMVLTLSIVIFVVLCITLTIVIKQRKQNENAIDESRLATALQPYVEGHNLKLEEYLDAQGYQCYHSTREEYLYRDVDQHYIIITMTGAPDYQVLVGNGEDSYRQFGCSTNDALASAYMVTMSYWEDPQDGNGRLDEQQIADFYANTKPMYYVVNLPLEALNEIAALATR